MERQKRLPLEPAKKGPVECLGMTFESDEARRDYFLKRLKEKLQDPEFRKIPGFPKGAAEDILRMSDPPYYTACPNPFLSDFVAHYGRPFDNQESYHRDPYAAELRESRNNPFVNAHSYATKVPHKAVMRLLLHYTRPGDVVLDAYGGTGMTGVAAQLCGSPEPDFRMEIEAEMPGVQWGARAAILGDLAPAATHIARNLNIADDDAEFQSSVDHILSHLEEETAWHYMTRHSNNQPCPIVCTLWSDVFVCGSCSKEIVFWDAAVDFTAGVLRETLACPACGATEKKTALERSWRHLYDPYLRQMVRQVKTVPVVIVYEYEGKRYEKKPDEQDLAVIARAEQEIITDWFPTERMPPGDEGRRNDDIGLTHVHHFFTGRNLRTLAAAWRYANHPRIRFLLTSLMYKSSVLCSPLMSNYFAEKAGKPRGGWIGKERSGTLYFPSIHSEVPIPAQIRTRRSSVLTSSRSTLPPFITTASASRLDLPDNSIDYIFTDPPFGANRMYSELNFLWEAWLKVQTDAGPEAVENRALGKGLWEYEDLMSQGFREYYRVLKSGRWITVEFSNTRAAVWNALQNALTKAGFVVADVRVLDKKQGSIAAYTTSTAVRQDLAISAYKPQRQLEEKFEQNAGTEAGVWEFVSAHLSQLPVFSPVSDGGAEIVVERTARLLFDRMVAFHVKRGFSVPLSATEFQAGLRTRYTEVEGMFFLPDQLADYERKRATVHGMRQLTLFVTDEASAILWVRAELERKPQSFQDLNPVFMRELQSWAGHEKTVELKEILEENFLQYDGTGPVPPQIHTYLSTNFKHLRGLYKDDTALRTKAAGRWYVPDPNKQSDLDQLRTKRLLKEFQQFKESKQKKLKLFRTEAVRAGFKHAYDQKDYRTIVDVARKLPEKVIQEDEKLLMYYDVALMRLGED